MKRHSQELRKLALLPLVVGLSGCFFGGSSEVEVVESASPDGSLVASITETNGGATTSFGYIIKIQALDSTPALLVDAAFLYGAVRSDCAYGVDLNWKTNEHLEIQYLSADRIISSVESVLIGAKTIHVSLVPGVNNKAAPCGGMEYNLRREK